MYGAMGVKLPAATLVIVNASKFIADPTNIMKIIGIIIIIRVSYNFLYKNIEGFRHTMHKRFLKFPLFGDLIVKATVSRMCMIMANLTRAGVSIIDTIKISKSVTTNLVFIYALERVGKQIVTGQNLSEFLNKKNIFFHQRLHNSQPLEKELVIWKKCFNQLQHIMRKNLMGCCSLILNY